MPTVGVVTENCTGERFTKKSTASLAGSFLIQCSCSDSSCTFTLLDIASIEDIDDGAFVSESARSWAALMMTEQDAVTAKTANQSISSARMSMKSQIEEVPNEIGRSQLRLSIHIGQDSEKSGQRNHVHLRTHGDLLSILSRVLAQWTIQNSRYKESQRNVIVVIELAEQTIEEIKLLLTAAGDLANEKTIHDLFLPLTQGSLSEIVEMVDRDGATLGLVPRKLVHAYNILHRGIGVFVTANRPILEAAKLDRNADDPPLQQPDLYVHRRSDEKRIFPSLYDMFVGGISLAREPVVVTAQREVAEELGLKQGRKSLSDPLLQCVVCTDYNRCVVTLFSYAMNIETETVKWQEEEVAWGDFVPYAVVEAAADLSMQRLATLNKWPGRLPLILSPSNGQTPVKLSYAVDRGVKADWTTWDFVPDGLLVWQAWLLHIVNSK